MATEFSHSIKDSYEDYENLLTDQKAIVESVLVLEPKRNNKRWSACVSEVNRRANGQNDKLELCVEINITNVRKYSLKFFGRTITEHRLFAFDSDGPAHRNEIEGLSLAEQQVTTPHFHKFHETGFLVAYKTDPLRTPRECETLVSNCDMGFAHFCQEGNFVGLSVQIPRLLLPEELTLVQPKQIDPTQGVIFP